MDLMNAVVSRSGFGSTGNAYCDPGGVRFSDRFSDRFAKTAILERMFV